MTKGGSAGVADEVGIRHLLDKIDGMNVLAGQEKQAKLGDVNGEITRIEADLVGLRRMLVQHRQPNAFLDQQGTTLSGAISSAIKQLERLREYRDELLALPEDESATDDAGKGGLGDAD